VSLLASTPFAIADEHSRYSYETAEGVVPVGDGAVTIHFKDSDDRPRDPNRVTVDPGGKWTAEEILNSKPRDLPVADVSSLITMEREREATVGDIDTISTEPWLVIPPSEPTIMIDPNLSAVNLKELNSDDPPSRGAPIAFNATVRTGLLAFRDPLTNMPWNCSASTIATASKNIVVTAGHCVYDAIPEIGEPRFFVDHVFVPGY